MWRPCGKDYPVFSQKHTKQIDNDEEAKMYDENEREREKIKMRKKIGLMMKSAGKKNDKRAFA